jgi:hypothetical protein
MMVMMMCAVQLNHKNLGMGDAVNCYTSYRFFAGLTILIFKFFLPNYLAGYFYF